MKSGNRYCPKDARQKSEGVKEVRFKKNSTPSPWKRQKTPHPQLSAQQAPEG